MADEVERPKCGSCRYWEPPKHPKPVVYAEYGSCMRHAPTLNTDPNDIMGVKTTDWCGEHSNLEDGRIIYLADTLAERLGLSIENALHSGILHLRNTG